MVAGAVAKRLSNRVAPTSVVSTRTQYRYPATADARAITISWVRRSIRDGPGAAPRNGMTTSSSSET